MVICLVLEEETDDIKVSKQLELEGVQAAESGDIESALNLFSRAIQNTPERASGYNNRAQALRLKGDVQGT
jgi:Flp pilus assembly protein TadD